MKIDVYDTYYTNDAGHTMHFDVFVPHGTEPDQALEFGRRWLSSIGEEGDQLRQEKCQFCHTQLSNPKVAELIESIGFYIYQMEGCPVYN